jgi:hypothetical protein
VYMRGDSVLHCDKFGGGVRFGGRVAVHEASRDDVQQRHAVVARLRRNGSTVSVRAIRDREGERTRVGVGASEGAACEVPRRARWQ